MINDWDERLSQDKVRVVVAEINNKIAFALYLFIEQKDKALNGHIHDLLINPSTYSDLDDPQDILSRLVFCLDSISYLHGCSRTICSATTSSITSQTFYDLGFSQQETKLGDFWVKLQEKAGEETAMG